MVDEEVAAHHLVDHELLHQCKCAIVRENALPTFALGILILLIDEARQRLVEFLRRVYALEVWRAAGTSTVFAIASPSATASGTARATGLIATKCPSARNCC